MVSFIYRGTFIQHSHAQLDAERIASILKIAMDGDGDEHAALPLDDLEQWRDEIAGAAQLGIARAWARGWRSTTALVRSARRAAINEALAEHRRRGCEINRDGELERLARQVHADAYELVDSIEQPVDEVVTSEQETSVCGGVRETREVREALSLTSPPSPPSALIRSEMQADMRARVARLPHPHRLVVVGRYYDGLTQAQVAVTLGLSQQRVSEVEREALNMMRGGGGKQGRG